MDTTVTIFDEDGQVKQFTCNTREEADAKLESLKDDNGKEYKVEVTTGTGYVIEYEEDTLLKANYQRLNLDLF
ncbi:TPA: hypothetical protein PIX32_001864 [Staphylococcus aureus]|uniref:hypothetical protein n=1 Tax=Staphylococcus aureus TaxID=1280 RepID=UPI00101E066D|nr:hypothetical protein [Staphylococcus aureus]HBE6984870.1 hypothetical protein [Staphylococcus aureus]HBE8081667.1 hypothetical protein [Staphylococcus aureus]HBG3192961.1 hypothetical protein [Staphylococcus aureus]HCD1988621.1 hypothetical protein [Staphylococcus aureus]HCW7792444.1 hypothetical protein [Staphylococcus aureus]